MLIINYKNRGRERILDMYRDEIIENAHVQLRNMSWYYTLKKFLIQETHLFKTVVIYCGNILDVFPMCNRQLFKELTTNNYIECTNNQNFWKTILFDDDSFLCIGTGGHLDIVICSPHLDTIQHLFESVYYDNKIFSERWKYDSIELIDTEHIRIRLLLF